MDGDQRPPELPREVDVLVVGSGAAGLTAALTAANSGLSVLVVESSERFGGTTALSGGRVWIPPGDIGGDTPASAIEYLSAVLGDSYLPMIQAFVEGAKPMARFVESQSRHRFVPCPRYPDYHPHFPGATPGGRAYDTAPIRLRELVGEASDIHFPPGYIPITHAEWEAWRFPADFDWNLIEDRRKSGILTNGAGLVAGLIDGAVRAGANLVKGVELLDVEQDVHTSPIRAHVGGGHFDSAVVAGALILASGGFDASPKLRGDLLTKGVDVSASVPTNTGIALRLAQERDFAVDNLSEGWWMPMVELSDETVAGSPYPRALVRERGVPHQIAVNRAGVRFVDEASSYHEFVRAMHRQEDGNYPNSEAWLVFDEQFRRRYPFPGLGATGALPDHVATEPTVKGLAVRLGIDATALVRTVDRWNEICAVERDSDFFKGETVYDRYFGDPRLEMSPNLGTINEPPFYGVRIVRGTAGSKGGPVTNTDGQIIDNQGRLRPRWYAAGNAACFWTSDGYPAPGFTLAIGMTFGHRAALSATRFLHDDR